MGGKGGGTSRSSRCSANSSISSSFFFFFFLCLAGLSICLVTLTSLLPSSIAVSRVRRFQVCVHTLQTLDRFPFLRFFALGSRNLAECPCVHCFRVADNGVSGAQGLRVTHILELRSSASTKCGAPGSDDRGSDRSSPTASSRGYTVETSYKRQSLSAAMFETYICSTKQTYASNNA